MQNGEQISEVIRFEYIQSLNQNNGKSIEQLKREEDIMITFSELNVWFSNKDSDVCIEEVKNIFDSLEQTKLGKISLGSFMRGYSQRLMQSVQAIQSIHARMQCYKSIITNAECIKSAIETELSSNSNNNNNNNTDIISTSTSTQSSEHNVHTSQDIPNKLQLSKQYSKQREQTRKVKIQLTLKQITNIDLTPSFSKLNLEGYQIEIGVEDKKIESSSVRCLEGVSINMREEQIDITIRPKCQTIFIRLYEVLTHSRNLVASIVIDPFTLLYPSSFNNNLNASEKLSSHMNNLIHTIPLQSQQTGTYCNLILSSLISPATTSQYNTHSYSEFDKELSNKTINYNLQILNVLQQRIIYMNEKYQQSTSKYQKMIDNIQLFVKPFQSIKLDDYYLKQQI